MGKSPRASTQPPPPPGSDRRRHERFEVLAQVEFSANEEVSIVPIVNLSAGGVLVRFDSGSVPRVSAGDEVTLFMDLSEVVGEELTLELGAEVVRADLEGGSSEPTIAFMWTSRNPELVSKLAKVLTYLAEH